MTKAAEWKVRVDAWRASGLSATEFCKGKDFTVKGLQWWSSHLRRTDVSFPKRARTETRLARVVQWPTVATASMANVIVVEIDGARVEVPAEADRMMLSLVFDALRARVSEAPR